MLELLIILLALTAIAVYSYVLRRRKPSEGWSWVSGLLATLISIVLGVAVALLMFRYTGEQEDAVSRMRFRHLLKAEMTDTFRILASDETMDISSGQSTCSVLVTYIQPIAIEEAAKSALFDEITTENLLHLARKMRMYNLKTQFLLSSLAADNSRVVMEFACTNVKVTRLAILDDLTLMMDRLHMEFPPSIDEE